VHLVDPISPEGIRGVPVTYPRYINAYNLNGPVPDRPATPIKRLNDVLRRYKPAGVRWCVIWDTV